MKNFINARRKVQAIANLFFGGNINAAFKAIQLKRVEISRKLAKYFQAIANLFFGTSMKDLVKAIKGASK